MSGYGRYDKFLSGGPLRTPAHSRGELNAGGILMDADPNEVVPGRVEPTA